MSKFTPLFVGLLSMALGACEPYVTFSEPQPADTENLDRFPKKLQGSYLSTVDSSVLWIKENEIYRVYDLDYILSVKDLDSNHQIADQHLVNLSSGERTPISQFGDSFRIHIHNVDTLFQLSYDNVVRKLKGYYFINTRMSSESWEVKQLHLSRGKLQIGSLTTKEDIAKLQEITETPQDTLSPLHFSITKKQFKAFVKQDGFSDTEVFIRQKRIH